jgi:hypothetical protein
MSNAVVTTANMELSPCRVNYKGVDLGGTLKNVNVKIEYVKSPIHADQSGETIRDRRTSGLNIMVETSIAEVQNKNNWKVVFPHAQLVNDGMGNKMIYFVNNIGDSDLANAGPLILHPLSKADADLSGNFLFYLACADAKSEYVLGPKEQATLKITWNILPDSTTAPERFFIHGDPTIGPVAASAAAAVPGGGNVGNGVFAGTAVFQLSKTETITFLCIDTSAGPTAAIFQVSGNLSGPLGNLSTGTGFASPVIATTLNEGGTPFAKGDTFTIAVTSANYI